MYTKTKKCLNKIWAKFKVSYKAPFTKLRFSQSSSSCSECQFVETHSYSHTAQAVTIQGEGRPCSPPQSSTKSQGIRQPKRLVQSRRRSPLNQRTLCRTTTPPQHQPSICHRQRTTGPLLHRPAIQDRCGKTPFGCPTPITPSRGLFRTTRNTLPQPLPQIFLQIHSAARPGWWTQNCAGCHLPGHWVKRQPYHCHSSP